MMRSRLPLVSSFAGMWLALGLVACGSTDDPAATTTAGAGNVAGNTAALSGGGALDMAGAGSVAGGATAGAPANDGTAGVASMAGAVGVAGQAPLAAGAAGVPAMAGMGAVENMAGAAGAGAAGASAAGGAAGAGGDPAAGASGNGGAPMAGDTGETAGMSAAAGAAGADSGEAGGGSMEVVERPGLVTSGPNSYWQTGTLTPASGGQATVTVNANTVRQEWIGFGGTFNEAGWDALGVLDAAERERAIRLLFSASEGANFAWGRIPIGASDYAMDRYTLNETPGDFDMANFSIARDRELLIPYIQAAQDVKSDIHFWASPWTPPSWMKDPAEINGTDPDINGNNATFEAFMKSDTQTLDAFALYLARFVEEYEKEGIHISSVHPQNEPGYSSRYPSCRWEAGLLSRFVGQHMAPTFTSRGLDTEIWFGTLSNNNTYADQMSGLTGAAANAVTGVGLQWNTMSHVGDLAGQGYLVLQTEHRCGNYPFTVSGAPAFNPDKPQNDHAYAIESWGYIRDWLKAGVNGYSAWNMVLDTVGKNLDDVRPWPQNALLTVDRGSQTLIETPAYYVFRHFSYFVDPGAVRVDATGGDAIAFKNPDGSLVAVIFNSGNQAAQTTVAMGASTFDVQVPGQGWATVHFKE